MPTEILSPEILSAIEEAVEKAVERRQPMRNASWTRDRMLAAMGRIVERRKRLPVVPHGELEDVLDEHRREIGRGPLNGEAEAGRNA